jgi:hypothetical protein
MLRGRELTHVLCTAVRTATETNIKRKALSAFEELEIIKKVGAQPCLMGTMVVEQLSVPGLTNNIRMNMENMLLQCVPTKLERKKTSKYEKNEPALL